jgi:hypothetical protein
MFNTGQSAHLKRVPLLLLLLLLLLLKQRQGGREGHCRNPVAGLLCVLLELRQV